MRSKLAILPSMEVMDDSQCQLKWAVCSFEEWKQKEWGEEGEVRSGSEGDWTNALAALMNEEQEGCGERGGKGDGPRGLVIQKGEGSADDGDDAGQKRQVTEGEAGCSVGWILRGVAGVVLPGIDEEAVETAESREEKR